MARGQDTSRESNPTSIVFEHCQKVYRLMLAEAEPETEQVEVDETEEAAVRAATDDPADYEEPPHVDMVYTGFFTKLITEQLKLSVPYYSKVKNELIRMGCIRQLRRGGSSSPSKWLLIKEPDEELFRSGNVIRKPGTTRADSLQQQLTDMNHRISTLEAAERTREALGA